MKYWKSVAVCAMVLSLLPFAFAKEKDRGSLALDQPAMVGSAELQPGHYQVRWSGTSGKVQVEFLRGHKSVATAEGELVEHAAAAPSDAVDIKTMANNSKAIEEIDFGGKKEALVFSTNAN